MTQIEELEEKIKQVEKREVKKDFDVFMKKYELTALKHKLKELKEEK